MENLMNFDTFPSAVGYIFFLDVPESTWQKTCVQGYTVMDMNCW